MADSVLRLRKRRDGSMCLTGPGADIGDPRRAFPATFEFTPKRLRSLGHAVVMTGDEIRLELANARATYGITGSHGPAVAVTLRHSELFDPAPIDEEKAVVIAEQIAEENHQEALAAARVLIEADGPGRSAAAPGHQEPPGKRRGDR